MAGFVAGEVVVVPFPFSDLSGSQRRPALILVTMQGDDLILCQITSQARRDNYALPLSGEDFSSGKLKQDSFLRPNKLFTLDQNEVLYSVGQIRVEKLEAVIETTIQLLRGSK